MKYFRRKAQLLQQSFFFGLLAVGLFFAAPALTLAAPGDLDAGFGNGGIVVTPITDVANLYEDPHAMEVQPDGKIVVSGVLRYIDEETSYEVSTFLVRYNPNGTLDASFGTNGKVIWNGNTRVGYNIALQPDGKIVAIGYGSGSFAIHRYNPDGTLDASFGAGGIVVTQVGSGDFARDVAVQPDGKIIVIGQAFVPGNDYDFAVVRYNPDGSLDNSFAAGGKATTAVRDGNAFDEPSSVVLQPDGKIVVVGTSIISGNPYDFALVRYNANGSLDSGFGVNGKIIHTIFNVNNHGLDVALQPDGKIVAAGGRFGQGPTAIVRYNANGSIDTSFATNGVFSTESGFFVGHDIALQPDGKIVAFGNSAFRGFAVARLNPNGSPDASFGTNGRLITRIGTNDSSAAFAGTLQSDGKILAFGGTRAPDGDHIALTRHLGDSASPNYIDDPTFFVRQHYLDFLSREPDPAGLAFWTGEITSCGGDVQCVEVKRVNVSAAFFLSIEYQETGYLTHRACKVAYGDLPGKPVPLTLQEYLAGSRQIGEDVQVGVGNWQQQLEANKAAFFVGFISTSRFAAAHGGRTHEQFVDALNQNAVGALSASERDSLVGGLNVGSLTRAQVLRAVAEDVDFAGDGRAEKNRAFVLAQYFGYLRRNPDGVAFGGQPDPTFEGYNFWLSKLNQFNGNFIEAEMVKAFITSIEYRQRFGQP